MEYLTVKEENSDQFVEKKSRFIGTCRPVKTEEEALDFIARMKSKYWDASHNVYAYILRENGVQRFSDDGEPQGTAGQPMLGVFQKEGVTNVCCVVTRYFGGVLLGAGGLVRAYTQAAKLALDEAGISVVRRWVEVEVTCPYSLFERVKNEAAAQAGVLGDIGYTDQVTVRLLLPEERVAAFSARMVELSAGACRAVELGEAFQPVPIK